MAGTQADIPASYMHPGLLDYHTYYLDSRYLPDEQANRRNMRLWERVDEKEDQPTLEAWRFFRASKAAAICLCSLRCMACRCTRP